MRGNLLLLIVFLFVFLPKEELHANVFADIRLSKNSVYVQEPFRVTITVYTTTWFSAPLEFGNLQIPNSFIVPFDRTQPGMFTSRGKQYAGVQFYYIVFPYQVGEFVVPAFDITAHSPAEGSSTPQTIAIHTQEYKFTVRDVPKKLKDTGIWMVAKNVKINESWSPPLKDLKIGDVIKRTISVEAQGTLPQFIPDLFQHEDINWASTYSSDPILSDPHNNNDVSGSSTQTITYLLEKKGNFKAPVVKLLYWNPVLNRIIICSTAETNMQVEDNPNLGILTTLKDSLQATQKHNVLQSEVKGPLRILGVRWYYFLLLVVGTIAILYYLIKFVTYISLGIKRSRQKYLQSETYYFRKMMRAGVKPNDFLPALYEWWDNLKIKPSASIVTSLRKDKADAAHVIQTYLTDIYAGKEPTNVPEIKCLLKKYRKEIKRLRLGASNGNAIEVKLAERQKAWH